ncbi:TPA: hypothetical protein DIC40_03105 [Patescibacteria group bacterium]|nr:hypothetical protein P148_SR1C00001G0383 [candidate division SR1 bacterium RAAC1_SR1_1]HCY20832.1 hypothetical protein [Candidatus Gracilibacteria bacterium]
MAGKKNYSEKDLFEEESKREFHLPKEQGLPRGFQTFTPSEYFERQEKQNAEVESNLPKYSDHT